MEEVEIRIHANNILDLNHFNNKIKVKYFNYYLYTDKTEFKTYLITILLFLRQKRMR